jgi:hypothetical protein
MTDAPLYFWKGRPLHDLTREELERAVIALARLLALTEREHVRDLGLILHRAK